MIHQVITSTLLWARFCCVDTFSNKFVEQRAEKAYFKHFRTGVDAQLRKTLGSHDPGGPTLTRVKKLKGPKSVQKGGYCFRRSKAFF